MFAALKKGLLKLAGRTMKDFVCPKCGCKFVPFQDRELTSWEDQIVCPQCGNAVTVREAMKTQGEVKVNPPGPFARPAQTKIERKPVSSTQLLFFIPASGRSGGLLFFAIFWNAISWTVFLAFLFGLHAKENSWMVIPFTAMFPVIGLIVAYIALRMRFATHLLYLSPDQVRLQRQFFGRRKNFDLATAGVVSVRKKEFYQQNYQPVYGIEIRAPEGKIRFGSILTDDEKNWLCWEIRTFLRPYAPSLTVAAAETCHGAAGD